MVTHTGARCDCQLQLPTAWPRPSEQTAPAAPAAAAAAASADRLSLHTYTVTRDKVCSFRARNDPIIPMLSGELFFDSHGLLTVCHFSSAFWFCSARSACLPKGLYILLAFISLFFYYDQSYLSIYWTDFHHLFTKWKVFA